MAVPTRDEFSAFLTLAEAPIQTTAALPEIVTEQDAIAFLIDVERGRQCRARELSHTAVWVWLIAQREFQRAVRLAYRKPRTAHPLSLRYDPHPSIEDRAKTRAREILQSNGRDDSKRHTVQTIHHQLEITRHGRFKRSWHYKCIRALAEYYDGDAGRELPELTRKIEEAHREASEAVRRYRALSERLNAFEISGVRAPSGFREFTATPDLSGMPLRRREPRACERLFVYRMDKANRAVWVSGPPRAEAIAELMNLEGFRHQYDVRTIEKLCAEFHKLDRQLAARNRALIAGLEIAQKGEETNRGT